jgi:hypothetical protein
MKFTMETRMYSTLYRPDNDDPLSRKWDRRFKLGGDVDAMRMPAAAIP